jgi:hypothetical protein
VPVAGKKSAIKIASGARESPTSVRMHMPAALSDHEACLIAIVRDPVQCADLVANLAGHLGKLG